MIGSWLRKALCLEPEVCEKSGGRPPAAPDYIGAAREQGSQNLEAIRTGAALNRVNQVTPWGSVTYSRSAPSGGAQQPQTITSGGVPQYGFTGGNSLTDFVSRFSGRQPQFDQPAASPGAPDTAQDQWTQTTTLSPEQQRIFDQGQTNQIDLGRVAGLRLGDVGKQGSFNLNGLPAQVTGVDEGNLERDVGLPGAEQRSRAEDAIYRTSSRYLDPQFSQREEQARTRLINSGVREGSEAWNTELGNLGREREAAYADARDRAVVGGGQEASRMLSDDLSRAGFANTSEGQRFAQALQNASLQNQGRAAGVNERLTERQVPLSEFMSLYGGGGGSPLNPPGIPQAGAPAPGDYQGAIGQQYGAQVDQYNARQQQAAQTNNALLSLASIFALSDRRVKRDYERTGELPNGIPIYRYRYLWDDTWRTGVMADEVREISPDAVITGPDGFERVNYAAIGAAHLLGAN